jgi:hypothetical protein
MKIGTVFVQHAVELSDYSKPAKTYGRRPYRLPPFLLALAATAAHPFAGDIRYVGIFKKK